MVRHGLASILARVDSIEVVGEASSAEEALSLIPRAHPGVCLSEVRLPKMNGIHLCAEIARRHPFIRTVLLSSLGDSLTVDAAFDAGARGFLLKTSAPAVIVKAIGAVAAGDVVLDPDLQARPGTYGGSRKLAKGAFDLTPQELRVLQHLPRGLTNRGIGDALGITEETVKTHIKRILFKLGARDRTEALAIAHREGLL